jgi:hypothetical protein
MEVMFQASLGCRSWGWSGEVSAEHLADLMDAIHNIPALVRQWELCDVEWLRADLMAYQRKWGGRGGLALCGIFDDVVTSAAKRTQVFVDRR